MPLDGLRVLSLESRRAVEIDLLLRKQGAQPLVAPSVRERVQDDHSDAFRLLERLESNRFDLVVLMTGVGLTFWRDVVAGKFGVERADDALRKNALLVRGPKPAAVLRNAGIAPAVTVPEPNTWREIVPIIAQRSERRIAVQEYGRPNGAFVEALTQLGAEVETFSLYRWELPEDTEPLRKAVEDLAGREVDVALFTSSVQLDHLLMVARERGLANHVVTALREYTVVASVGPIMSEALNEQGIAPDIEPESPKMGPLVYATSAQAQGALERKRARSL